MLSRFLDQFSGAAAVYLTIALLSIFGLPRLGLGSWVPYVMMGAFVLLIIFVLVRTAWLGMKQDK